MPVSVQEKSAGILLQIDKASENGQIKRSDQDHPVFRQTSELAWIYRPFSPSPGRPANRTKPAELIGLQKQFYLPYIIVHSSRLKPAIKRRGRVMLQ
ncbi:MAG: hypothetical protein KDJ38_04540 [Gammaproteobacteria bacterium]|nr:hypothetical protein [Gammaproteobacteria bacterium]